MAATNPTAPLFVPSLEELQAKLRLGGLKEQGDAVEILNEAIQTARGEFYRRLGGTQLSTLVAITYDPEPAATDNDGYLRLIAANTEVLIIRAHLLRTLPVLFRDSSGDHLQEWNDEGAIRELEGDDLEALLKAMAEQISENMELLAGEEVAGEEKSIRASTIGPATTPPKPGASVFNYYEDD